MIAIESQEALWRDYRERLFRFVLRRVEDPSTAEDIVHDVLVRAYDRQDTLRNARKFEQWIFQITRNAVIDHYRGRRPTEALPPDLAVPAPDVGSAVRAELATCLGPLIDSLPERYREAVLLAELEGYTQQATADRLGLSLSGAKSRVQRGRRMLAEKMLACCRVELDSRGAIAGYEPRDECGPEHPSGCPQCGVTPPGSNGPSR